jgi:gliding motility-associated peptidyl-prolyl isomerase
MMKKLLSLLIFSLFIACQTNEARRPIQYKTGSFLDTSIATNKAINNQEYTLIENFISNSKENYIRSSYGFWYKYDIKNIKSEYTPKFGDRVYYSYWVKDLNGNWIYSPKETQEKNYYVEEEEIFIGLREGLKLMKKGEKLTFIFPSQLAYGYYGDTDKIGADTPLIYQVTVRNIHRK